MEDQRKVGLIRINGFSSGVHPLQIFAYIVYISALVIFTICVFPFFESTLQIVSGVLYYISLAAMAFLAFLCSYSDPTDPIIRKEKEARLKNKEYDTVEYEYYCSTCISHVQDGSKHCRQCDRCVNGFDHHCKWLNNCIGRENYRLFYLLISFVFINSIIYCVFLAYSLNYDYQTDNNDSFQHKSYARYITMKIFVWIYLIIIGFIGILDLNLLLFHTWLANNNLTTYEYIINSRNAKTERIPYGICSGVAKYQEFQLQQNENNFPQQQNQLAQPPKRKDTIQNWNKRSFIAKKKKINSIIPLDGAEINQNDLHIYKSSHLDEEQENLNHLNPFSQNIMEGIIEKSICNSADVQEEDLRTEIGRQENKMISVQAQSQIKGGNKQQHQKGKNRTLSKVSKQQTSSEIQLQNMQGIIRGISNNNNDNNNYNYNNHNNQESDQLSQNQNIQINYQHNQFYGHKVGRSSAMSGQNMIHQNNINTSPLRQSQTQLDGSQAKKAMNTSAKRLNANEYISEINQLKQQQQQQQVDIFLEPKLTKLGSMQNNDIDHFNNNIEKDQQMNSNSFRNKNDFANENDVNSQRQINMFNQNTDNAETVETRKAGKLNFLQSPHMNMNHNKDDNDDDNYTQGRLKSTLITKDNSKIHTQIEAMSKSYGNQGNREVRKPSLSHRNTNELSDVPSMKEDYNSNQLRRGASEKRFSPKHSINCKQIHSDIHHMGSILDEFQDTNQVSNIESHASNANMLNIPTNKIGEQTALDKNLFLKKQQLQLQSFNTNASPVNNNQIHHFDI